jgi:hypothetical protein
MSSSAATVRGRAFNSLAFSNPLPATSPPATQQESPPHRHCPPSTPAWVPFRRAAPPHGAARRPSSLHSTMHLSTSTHRPPLPSQRPAITYPSVPRGSVRTRCPPFVTPTEDFASMITLVVSPLTTIPVKTDLQSVLCGSSGRTFTLHGPPWSTTFYGPHGHVQGPALATLAAVAAPCHPCTRPLAGRTNLHLSRAATSQPTMRQTRRRFDNSSRLTSFDHLWPIGSSRTGVVAVGTTKRCRLATAVWRWTIRLSIETVQTRYPGAGGVSYSYRNLSNIRFSFWQ